MQTPTTSTHRFSHEGLSSIRPSPRRGRAAGLPRADRPPTARPGRIQEEPAAWKGDGFWIRLAEEEGFEPSYPGIPDKRFSRPPHSTTLPPLRVWGENGAGAFGQPRRLKVHWRRVGDLNPGDGFAAYTISNRAPSATRTTLRKSAHGIVPYKRGQGNAFLQDSSPPPHLLCAKQT